MKVANLAHPSAEQSQAFFGAAEDGPFVMVNLFKFRKNAEYPNRSDAHLSGREAFLRYGMAVRARIERVDGKPGYAGPVTGLMLGEVEELWDMVALVEYPSLEAMRAMVKHPEYQEVAKHRSAGLAGQVNIKTKGQLT